MRQHPGLPGGVLHLSGVRVYQVLITMSYV